MYSKQRICRPLIEVKKENHSTTNKLLRACNLTSFSPYLTGPLDYPFASCHKGPGFKSPGGYLCETGILLLALSRYIAIIKSGANEHVKRL
jgi:hypothetical protein